MEGRRARGVKVKVLYDMVEVEGKERKMIIIIIIIITSAKTATHVPVFPLFLLR